MKTYILLIIFSLSLSHSYSQERVIDSLVTELNKPFHDTEKVKILNDLTWEYIMLANHVKATEYASQALALSSSVLNRVIRHGSGVSKDDQSQHVYSAKRGLAVAYHYLGTIAYYKGNYANALDLYDRSLKIKQQINDQFGVANSNNNIGVIYENKGDYPKAIEYYIKALKIRESLNHKKGIADSYSNIGNIHLHKQEYDKALEYYKKSMDYEIKNGNKQGIADAYNNMGATYEGLGELDNAFQYHTKALVIRREIDDKQGIANSLHNIGSLYNKKGDLEKAMDYYLEGLEYEKKVENDYGIAISYQYIGSALLRQNKPSEARSYHLKSLEIAKETSSLLVMMQAYRNLAQTDSALKDFRSAFENYKLFTSVKDSIFNEEANKKSIEAELEYDYEKKELAQKKEQEKKEALHSAELEKEQLQRYGLYLGLSLVLGFSALLFNRFRTTQNQKRIIEEQKHLVEEKNKDILDSIKYAKRLQLAILPPVSFIEQHLLNCFILYKPKDIVAGDFYWMEKKGDRIFLAAADCTGHGVPGALVSVVCSNALNRTINEFEIKDPGKILDKVTELVIETFEKSESEVKDGMDVSLCTLRNIDDSRIELSWSGANNPIWIISPNTISTVSKTALSDVKQEIIGDYTFSEIKANKQPVGKFSGFKPFTTHTMILSKGDTFYLFTDGYADQFGGEKGKKFKYSKLKELLLSIQPHTVSEQEKILNQAFESWKGGLEQVDDVCMIGVRI